MATDDVHIDDRKESRKMGIGDSALGDGNEGLMEEFRAWDSLSDEAWEAVENTFTVEARVEDISEEYAEALATRLAAMGLTVWIKALDITPEQGES